MALPLSDRSPRSGVVPAAPRTRYSIENRVGKLVEIRIASPVYIEDAIQWGRDHDAVIDAVRGPYVCVVDLVDATVFPQNVVEAYVAVMKSEPRLLRTGTLLNESPTFGMQIQRMIREANHPARRTFRDPEELAIWLGEVLDEKERARLAEMLASRLGGAPSVPGSAPGSAGRRR
ncbi:MAG: hypothetical protein U0359_36870 [Byssovorax sp.]